MKKLMLVVVALAVMVHTLEAAGFGFYVPYAFKSNLPSSTESGLNYKETAGLGVMFDSNMGKNRVFNYRLSLEFMNKDAEDRSIESRYTTMLHTFGFGIVRTQALRLWIGPRIVLASVQTEYSKGSYYSSTSDSESAIEFGFAPALGMNVNLGSVVSLGVDIDYKFTARSGVEYGGGLSGLTTRFVLMFRFGEKFIR